MKTLIILLVLLVVVPGQLQESSNVPVREVGVLGVNLHPLGCIETACFRLTELLFPTFDGLTSRWDADDRIYTFHLKEQRWSNGQPITAYDVFYSYMALTTEQSSASWKFPLLDVVNAVVPLDERTIAFVLRHDLCQAESFTGFPVAAAPTRFAEAAAGFFRAAGELQEQFDSWQQYTRENAGVRVHLSGDLPTITSGDFRLEPGWGDGEIRLYRENPAIEMEGYVYLNAANRDDAVDRFVRGEANFITNPPFDRRDDIRALSNVQITETAGREWDIIAFNYADPQHPRSFDHEEGQGHHPIFSDIRVRRAIQMALNMPEIMEASIAGDGQSIAPMEFNPREAERLLEAAGWTDVNRDGIRECNRCLYARRGTRLSFNLLINSRITRHHATARIIELQLGKVGISVNWQPVDERSLREILRRQQFDAVLDTWRYPDFRFFSEEDVLESGLNFMSYANPEVDALLRDSCGRDLDLALHQDQAMIWLFRPDEFYAALPRTGNGPER
jgi:ABC-type transport system substrate-binding protein